MSTRNYQEARTIYLNLSNATDRRDWKAVGEHISRLGDLVMDLAAEEAPQVGPNA